MRPSAAGDPSPARPAGHRRLLLAFLGFLGATVLLCLAVVLRAALEDGTPGFAYRAAVGLIAFAVAACLGALTLLLWRSRLPALLRWPLVLAAGYHALCAPLFLLYTLTTRVTSNDDWWLVLYPHVVRWINSFE